MTTDELIAWAKMNGWREDRYGHLQRETSNGTKYRLKLGARNWRYERQITLTSPYQRAERQWIRVYSAPYGKTSIGVDGKLTWEK